MKTNEEIAWWTTKKIGAAINGLLIVVFGFLLAGCAAYQRPQHVSVDYDNTKNFEQASKEWKAELDSGKISELEYANKTLLLGRSLFPDDPLLLAFLNYRVYLSEKLHAQEITKSEYSYKIEEKRAEYYAARERKWATEQASQPTPAQVDMAPYFLLNGIGNAFRNASQSPVQINGYQPPVQCTTTQPLYPGGAYRTDCF